MIRRLILIALIVVMPAHCAELARYTIEKLHEAQQLQADGKLTQAIKLLAEVDTSRRYDKVMIARSLGVYYWQNCQVELAIKSLNIAVLNEGLEPKALHDTQNMLADIYFNHADYHQANKLYYLLTQSVSDGEVLNEVWFKIAKAHYQLMEWQKTLHALSKITSPTTTTKIDILTLKVSTQLKLKQWHSAGISLQSLLTLDATNPIWWQQLVNVQLQQGDSRSALITLSVANNQYDFSPEESQLYAQLLTKHGVPDQAATEVGKLDELSKTVDGLVLQASLWEKAKEWQRAAQIWLQVAKNDAQYYSNAIRIYMQQQQFVKALETVVKIPEQNAEILLLRAQILSRLNRNEEALKYALRADKVSSTKNSQSWVQYLNQLKQHTSVNHQSLNKKGES